MLSPGDRKRLTQYLSNLKEKELQDEIAQFFVESETRCQVIHGGGEHGIDLIAHVDERRDPMGTGYNILVQVKRGDVSQNDFHELLGQLVEGTYFPFSQSPFDPQNARRVVLICSGNLTNEASLSIQQFNLHHGVTLECFDLDSLIELFVKKGYADNILDRITEIGSAPDAIPYQPSLGDPYEDDPL